MRKPPHLDRTRRFISSILLISFSLALVTYALFGVDQGDEVAASGVSLAPEQTNPSVQFDTASTTVTEGNSSSDNTEVSATVELSSALTDSEVGTVTFQTIEGTARAPSDFTTASGILTFTASVSERTINVQIFEDTTAETDETFSIVLQSPENATLGSVSIIEVTIRNDDNTPTPTSSSGTATPVYIDQYEGNDTLQTAYTLDTETNIHCTNNDATFWPAGDEDFYRFWARKGQEYVVTSEVSEGIDTIMTLYDPEGHLWLRNDNNLPGVRTSEIRFTSDRDAYHFVSLVNEDPSDPANKFYCIRFTENSPTLTPTPTATTEQFASDICEDNDDLSRACVQTIGVTHAADFVPNSASQTDIDFYRIWAKEGVSYTCETTELSDFNDTFMAALDLNFARVAENDDIGFPDLGSRITYFATYTGWLYLQVEPRVPVEYSISNLYTYSLTCQAEFVTPTFTPFPTSPVINNPVASTPTPTPIDTPSVPVEFPTIDVLATVNAAATPTLPPTRAPVIEVRPLPTNTPFVTQVFTSDVSIIIFYDRNGNNLPEIDEGIQDMPVYVYDGVSGQLLTLGYTNEAGMLNFQAASSFNTVRVDVPYLGISQVVSMSTSEILIRVASNISN
ncbi:MAG: Calx-beta domain-containing protein [Chloroflexota bacterium]